MKFKEAKCFWQTDAKGDAADYAICFIKSGFEGIWIKVWSLHDYSCGADWALDEENSALNKIEKK